MIEDKEIRNSPGGQVKPLPLIEFNSLLELRNRYPFASAKCLGNIWKFIRPYDFSDFSLQVSTAPVTKVKVFYPPIKLDYCQSLYQTSS